MSMLFGPRRALLGGAVAPTYAEKVLSYSPIAYWPLWEAAGATAVDQVNSPAQDGTYTGVTLGQPGIGDGNTCPLFDGINDWVNVLSAALTAAWNGDALTVAIWMKAFNAATWATDWDRAWEFNTDANNFVQLIIHSTDGNLVASGQSNTNVKWVNRATGSPLTWLHTAVTVSQVANETRLYFNGTQAGATGTAVGNWVGALAWARIGSGFNNEYINAWLAHCAVWDTPLTPAQIADLAVV